jgi:hypothetical protein
MIREHTMTFGIHRADPRVIAVRITCESEDLMLTRITGAVLLDAEGREIGHDATDDPTWSQIQDRIAIGAP